MRRRVIVITNISLNVLECSLKCVKSGDDLMRLSRHHERLIGSGMDKFDAAVIKKKQTSFTRDLLCANQNYFLQPNINNLFNDASSG